jgi:hypothetical protein
MDVDTLPRSAATAASHPSAPSADACATSVMSIVDNDALANVPPFVSLLPLQSGALSAAASVRNHASMLSSASQRVKKPSVHISGVYQPPAKRSITAAQPTSAFLQPSYSSAIVSVAAPLSAAHTVADVSITPAKQNKFPAARLVSSALVADRSVMSDASAPSSVSASVFASATDPIQAASASTAAISASVSARDASFWLGTANGAVADPSNASASKVPIADAGRMRQAARVKAAAASVVASFGLSTIAKSSSPTSPTMPPLDVIPPPPSITDECAHCGCDSAGVPILRRCLGCYVVKYCSPACQKSGWRKHKPACLCLPSLSNSSESASSPARRASSRSSKPTVKQAALNEQANALPKTPTERSNAFRGRDGLGHIRPRAAQTPHATSRQAAGLPYPDYDRDVISALNNKAELDGALRQREMCVNDDFDVTNDISRARAEASINHEWVDEKDKIRLCTKVQQIFSNSIPLCVCAGCGAQNYDQRSSDFAVCDLDDASAALLKVDDEELEFWAGRRKEAFGGPGKVTNHCFF